MENVYRALSPYEIAKAKLLMSRRTGSEKRAFQLLPECMKKVTERNPAIAFKGCAVFYPDLFLRNEKICIEIDGAYHSNRKLLDEYRDKVFKEHGFIVIRIVNQDTYVNVAFWQRLLEELENSQHNFNHPNLNMIKAELRQLIDQEIDSWTCIEE